MHLSSRLIKGDGEVLEEIVSKERHKEINKVAGTCCRGGWVHPEVLSFLPGDSTDSTRSRGSSMGTCGWVLWVFHPRASSFVSARVLPFAASHPGGRAGLPGEDRDAAVSVEPVLLLLPAQPEPLSLPHADSTASGCFPGAVSSSPSKQLLPSPSSWGPAWLQHTWTRLPHCSFFEGRRS